MKNYIYIAFFEIYFQNKSSARTELQGRLERVENGCLFDAIADAKKQSLEAVLEKFSAKSGVATGFTIIEGE